MTPQPTNRQYFLNIGWSWLGFGVVFLTGAVVTPVLIRRLGTAQFGIWALAMSLIEYFWMIDLGLRPATVKLTAELRALNSTHQLNRLINTALCYSALAGSTILAIGWLTAERIGGILHINDPGFVFLIRVVGI